jgi:hypothetical protein
VTGNRKKQGKEITKKKERNGRKMGNKGERK